MDLGADSALTFDDQFRSDSFARTSDEFFIPLLLATILTTC